MAHAEATDHSLAKKVLIDVANEERVHAGEFERLLQILTGDEDRWLEEGREEVDELVAELAAAEKPAATTPKAGEEEATIGSLKE
jgi:uncharacterized protein